MKKFLMALIMISSLTGLATISESRDLWWAQLVRVVDGNTIEVRPVGQEKTVTVKLFGIYSPELDQSFGPQASDFLEDNLSGKELAIDEQDASPDEFGHTLATIYFLEPNQEIENMNEKLLTAGFAQWDADSSPVNYLFDEAQAQAQHLKLGIWSLAEAPSPRVSRAYPEEPVRVQSKDFTSQETSPEIQWYVIQDSRNNYRVVSEEEISQVIAGPFGSREAAESRILAFKPQESELQAEAPLPR